MNIIVKAITWIINTIKSYFSKEARAERKAKSNEEKARRAKEREEYNKARAEFDRSVETIANDNASEFFKIKNYTENTILEFIHTKQYNKAREMCNPVFSGVKYTVNPYRQEIEYSSTILEYYEDEDYKSTYNWFIASIKGAIKAKYPKAYLTIDTPFVFRSSNEESTPVKNVMKLHYKVYSDRIKTGLGSHNVSGSL